MMVNSLKSKVENMYIMLLYSIMKEDINRVKQYLSDDLVEHYRKVIENNIDNNIVQKYGELNVASVDVLANDEDYAVVKIIAKYKDYKINRTTKQFIDGDKKKTSHEVILKIRYQKENKDIVYRCPSCGAILNVNLTGVCEYCNEPLDDSERLSVIESIE